MINKVILVGNAGFDPEVKEFDNGDKIAKLSIATSETWKDHNGEKKTETQWHNVVFFKGLAKVVELYVKKGSQLYVEGKVLYKTFEKDGEKKYFTEINARELKLLGGKSAKTDNEPDNSDTDKDEDDLPF